MEPTTSKAPQTPAKPRSQLDDAVVQVERLYRAVVGSEPPADLPHTEIPPERDPGVFLNTQVERLLDALTNAAQPARAVPTWAPAATIAEEVDAFVIDLDVPGIPREGIGITVAAGMIEVTGERKVSNDLKQRQIRVSERPLGIFRRVLALPPECDISAVSAQLTHGVLSIRVPRARSAETSPRQVKVA